MESKFSTSQLEQLCMCVCVCVVHTADKIFPSNLILLKLQSCSANLECPDALDCVIM